jgi:hypothetical protein
MPITSDTWWSVTCDSCMEPVGDLDGMTPLADSLENAKELVSEYGGEIQHDGTENGRIVCSTCLEEANEPTTPLQEGS